MMRNKIADSSSMEMIGCNNSNNNASYPTYYSFLLFNFIVSFKSIVRTYVFVFCINNYVRENNLTTKQ